MRNAHAFDYSNIRGLFVHLLEHPTLKFFVAAVSFFGNWLFGGQEEALIVVLLLIILDTFAGMALACKNGELSSAGFFRFSSKVIIYLCLMATAALMDKSLPKAIGLPTMYSFLAVTEAISIMENFAAMGYSVPTKLLRSLKVYSDSTYKKGLKRDRKD